jgi:hypothetical protein
LAFFEDNSCNGASSSPSSAARRRKPVAARAQQPGRIYRIGFLGVGREIPIIAAGYQTFRDELRKRGFIDGRNLIVEFRSLNMVG